MYYSKRSLMYSDCSDPVETTDLEQTSLCLLNHHDVPVAKKTYLIIDIDAIALRISATNCSVYISVVPATTP